MTKRDGTRTGESQSMDGTRPAGKTPGFALYAVGIFVWMTFVSCCGATYALPFTPPQAEAAPYVLAQQGAYVLTFFIVAAAARKSPIDPPLLKRLWSLTVAAFAGFLVCLALFELGTRPAWLTALYGLFIGVGMTLGYMQWTALVAPRPQQEIASLVLIASLGSIASGAVLGFIPAEVRIALAAVVFMPASLALLRLYRIRYGAACPLVDQVSSAQRAQDSPQGDGGKTEGRRKAAGTQLFPSIVCAVVLSLVAPIVSATYMGQTPNEVSRNLIAQGANVVALLVVGIVMVTGRERLTMPDAYRILLPILATTVLVGALFPPERRWFVLFCSEACFCVVSLLLLLESCAISRQSKISVLLVYGILGGFVYLARTPEALFSLGGGANGALSPIVAAMLLYLLAIPSFILPAFSKRHTDSPEAPADAVPSPAQPTIDAACEELANGKGLTPRQIDVMKLLVKGVSTQRIAQTLSLSENTVATYRKAVYAALGVHARQELLDLVEAQMHTTAEA